MSKPALVEHPEVVVWSTQDWRCELWIVNGTPRLRLFHDGTIVRDFAVSGARDALQLGESWKTSVASYHRPDPY